MIKAKELREMKEHIYREDSVDLYLAFSLTMLDIIHAAKDGRGYHRIEGEEYYERETAESCYVLDYLEDLGYTVEKDCLLEFYCKPSYSTIISWRE